MEGRETCKVCLFMTATTGTFVAISKGIYDIAQQISQQVSLVQDKLIDSPKPKKKKKIEREVCDPGWRASLFGPPSYSNCAYKRKTTVEVEE